MRGRWLGQRLVGAAIGVAMTLSALAAAGQTPLLPTPEQFFGFPMGASGQLAHWDDMVEYYQILAQGSDRMAVEQLGTTTLGHPYVLVTISSPGTIRDLPRYQAMQKRLADPRSTTQAEADAIAQSGKAVVLIGANVHATEIGTSQVMNDIIHQLATERSAWVNHVLENTIVLLIPSQNPDGQRMVVEWYRDTIDTPYEGSPLPELYHPYAGHDNNRDSYMLTQVETQHLNRVLYQDWLPEVYLDAHQMGNKAARIFVPPFQNPVNANVDPLVWSQVNLLGQAMAAKLHEAGKRGVIWGELYNGYWQGANNTNPWWHNMVALLSEVASADLASPVRQDHVSARRWSRRRARAGRGGDRPRTLPAPTDTQSRMNYPQPWRGGTWTFADVVDYGRLSTQGLLEGVANRRTNLKQNFYRMNRRAIERFEAGHPFAFIIPADQHDRAALTKLLELLHAEAAEIHRATAPFVADGRSYPRGTFVARLDQPFGRWIKDILEAQEYPQIRGPRTDDPVATPYDITAWSLGMLMGVDTIRVEAPFSAELTLLTPEILSAGLTFRRLIDRTAASDQDTASAGDDGYLLSHRSNHSFIALNRLLAAGATVGWTEGPEVIDGTEHPAGTMVVTRASRTRMERLARTLDLDLVAARIPANVRRLPITAPRLAVYEPWGGNMDAGWTRWVLDQHEFTYSRLRNADLRSATVLDQFDVIVLPEMTTADLIRGQVASNVRPEYRGGIGGDGVRNLRRFVAGGGTVITLGNSAAFAVEHLSAPIVNVVNERARGSFSAPGTILRARVDTNHPVGFGMPDEIDVMFVDNGAYRPNGLGLSQTAPRIVVHYPDASLRRSGWIVGEQRIRGAGAVIEAPLGDGRVILHTFRVQHRGQTWGTFKLLFNSIYYGPAAKGAPSPDLTLDAAGH